MADRSTPELEQAVIDAYATGLDLTATSAACGTSRSNAQVILVRHGVARRPGGRRLYPVQHDAFSVLTPETAYWLGLLYADGSIDVGRNMVRLPLDHKDAPTLRRFHGFTGAPDRPLTRAGDTCLCATAASAELLHDLQRWGVRERKSWLDHEAPAGLAAEPAFWLGLMDGDGTVGWRKSGKGGTRVPMLSFLGNEKIMHQAARFLAPHTARSGTPSVYRQGRTGMLRTTQVTGVGAQSALRLMLGAVPVSMERKRAKALACLDWVPYAVNATTVACRACGRPFKRPGARGAAAFCGLRCKADSDNANRKAKRRAARALGR